MDHSVTSRLKELDEISQYVQKATEKMDDILLLLGFDKTNLTESLKNNSLTIICKQNKINGEQLLSENANFCDGSIRNVKIASIIRGALKSNPGMALGVPPNKLEDRDIPQTCNDQLFNFTREEKLALYEYVLNETGHFEEPEIPFTVKNDDKQKTMTFADIVALERDKKRRRMKYKTTKELPLSYTEEIRKLIGTQMDAWTEYVKDCSIVEKASEKERNHFREDDISNIKIRKQSRREQSSSSSSERHRNRNDHHRHQKNLKHRSKKHSSSRERDKSYHDDVGHSRRQSDFDNSKEDYCYKKNKKKHKRKKH